jgi:uncharacterized protein (AIM24 family)
MLDPNKQGSGMIGKLFVGAKRVLSGDTFFITTFMNAARVRRRVAFSSHFPGKIKPVDLLEWGGTIIAQKASFLCAPKGTNVDIGRRPRGPRTSRGRGCSPRLVSIVTPSPGARAGTTSMRRRCNGRFATRG